MIRSARSFAVFAGLFSALLALGACSSDDPAPAAGSGGSNASGCAAETRATAFSAGMSKASAGGEYTVMIESASPAPPDRNENTWMLHIKDSAGADVVGATVSAVPRMPDHKHGSSKPVVVEDMGSGKYKLSPVYFQMPGYWETTVSVEQAGKSADVMFGFCVEGLLKQRRNNA